VKYLYLEVIGRREYRGHRPGTRFVTNVDPALERGIARGNVRVIAEVDAGVKAGTYGLPPDWPRSAADAANTEAPKGASFVSEGGKK